jgi:glycosyltransferase involved in cell wall biosynthesis
LSGRGRALHLRVALITPGGLAPGGRENVIPALVAIASELARRHEVEVFAFGGPGPVTQHEIGGAVIHQLGDPVDVDPPGFGRRPRMLARLGGQLARALRATPRFDLLHAFWASEPGLFAAIAGGALQTPIVLTVGGGEMIWLPDIGYGGAKSSVGRGLIRFALRQADAITIGSAFAASFLDAKSRARARIIPLGIDSSAFEASPVRPPGPPWRLLHVGSLNRVKDHRTLLAAFAQVVAVAPLGDVTLDCVGEDTLGGEIQALARTLGVAERVQFHGFVPHDELAPFHRRAHLNLVSSRYESQSVSVLEAAAAGVPTVGTAVGLLTTLAPAAAAVVPPGDARALATAAQSLLRDPARREAMGGAAQCFARAHDTAYTVRAFEEIYRGLPVRAGRPGGR